MIQDFVAYLMQMMRLLWQCYASGSSKHSTSHSFQQETQKVVSMSSVSDLAVAEMFMNRFDNTIDKLLAEQQKQRDFILKLVEAGRSAAVEGFEAAPKPPSLHETLRVIKQLQEEEASHRSSSR